MDRSRWLVAYTAVSLVLTVVSSISLGYNLARNQLRRSDQQLLDRIERLETIVEPFRCPAPVENPPEPPTEVQNF